MDVERWRQETRARFRTAEELTAWLKAPQAQAGGLTPTQLLAAHRDDVAFALLDRVPPLTVITEVPDAPAL